MSYEVIRSRAPRATLTVLTHVHLREWLYRGVTVPQAGRLGPYGFEHLATHGWDVCWSDGAAGWPWTAPGVRRVRARVETADRQGLAKAWTSRASARRSDVIVSMFEDQGFAALTAKRHGLGPYADRPHVVISCWLAEHLAGEPERSRRAMVASLQAADRIIVFSSNQVPRLADMLGVPIDRIVSVPFGVDVDFFATEPVSTFRSGPVVTVGRDRSRDVDTFARAVASLDREVIVVQRRTNAPLDLPPNCRVRYDIPHVDYRRLLNDAALIVIPTTAPAYPSGSTVLLEAMAAGCPVIATDSPAMRDYIDPGINGELVAPGTADSLRSAIDALLADPRRAACMARTGREQVRSRFTQAAMWRTISEILFDASRARSHVTTTSSPHATAVSA